jgi:glyoxylase-like metal-dependent hydrolase (beta-lactamase superfamily II)
MARSITVGNIEIISITDGGAAMPPVDFFGNQDFSPYQDFLDADGNQPLRLGSFLIRDGSSTILVDTGLGERDNMFGMKGDILGKLAEVGVKPDEIDTVLTTHMHFDHIGGHTLSQGGKDVPAFPKASYPIRDSEWQYWTQPEVMAENPSVGSCAIPLADEGRLKLVGSAHNITSNVSYVDTPGHTPGHVSVLVMSQGKGALIIGDVSHSPMQIPNPSWSMPFDVDGDLAAKTRAAVFDRIVQEGLTLCAGHYAAGEGIGTIVEVEGKRTWRGV